MTVPNPTLPLSRDVCLSQPSSGAPLLILLLVTQMNACPSIPSPSILPLRSLRARRHICLACRGTQALGHCGTLAATRTTLCHTHSGNRVTMPMSKVSTSLYPRSTQISPAACSVPLTAYHIPHHRLMLMVLHLLTRVPLLRLHLHLGR